MKVPSSFFESSQEIVTYKSPLQTYLDHYMYPDEIAKLEEDEDEE